MISVLVVDDNLIRVAEINAICIELIGPNNIHFDTCASVQEAKERIVHNYYDLLISDLNLPRRPNETPLRDAGISLVRRIIGSKKYVLPSNTVAITSYDDIQKEYQDEFADHLITIVYYEPNSDRWKKQLSSKLEQIRFSKNSRSREMYSNKILITVHGIRTFGEWQKRFKNIVTASYPDIEVVSYKYGYFSVITYLLPIIRSFSVSTFSCTLKSIIDSNPGKSIDIVAHSFGTYIVGNTIKNLHEDYIGKVGTVILSGSVLPKKFKWQSLIDCKKVVRVINECGVEDGALLFNGLFVPFVGTGGLVGVSGGMTDHLINRFYSGGHSHFFIKSGKPLDDLMERYWIPLLDNDGPILDVDERKTPNAFSGVWAGFLHNLSIFKWSFYICLLILLYRLIST